MYPRAFLFLITLFFAPTAFSANKPLCVQTFNVYATPYATYVPLRLDWMSQELNQNPCEAVQFQELWQESDYERVADHLQKGRYLSLWADNFRYGFDGQKIGLASAFLGNILRAKSVLFQVNNEDGLLDWVRDNFNVQKGFSYVEAKLDNGLRALFLNLHTHPNSEAIRLAQIVQLIDFVEKNPNNLPLVLTGDLNAPPISLELDLLRDLLLLRDSFVEANGPYEGSNYSLCTYCSENAFSWSSQDQIIDYVLIRNGTQLAWSVEKSEINLKGNEMMPYSDHYGVRSHLAWQERTESVLNRKDKIVQDRISHALNAVYRTRQLLLGEHDEIFKDALDTLELWEKTFRQGYIPRGLVTAFLTP